MVLRVGRCVNSCNGGKCIVGINDCGKNGVICEKSGKEFMLWLFGVGLCVKWIFCDLEMFVMLNS